MYSNVNFRMDSDVKTQMTSICNQLGMSLSTAFNILQTPLFAAEEFRLMLQLKFRTRQHSQQWPRLNAEKTSLARLTAWTN